MKVEVVSHALETPQITQFVKSKLSSIPFKSEFTIVIFIHYKPQIAVAILDL